MLGFLIGGGKLILLGAPHWELRFRPFPRPALHVALTTLFHVLLSLAGIFSGFVVVFGLLKARNLKGWTTIFLWTTVATSVTGFLFPVHKLLPSHILGILSLIALAIAIVALYRRNLAGGVAANLRGQFGAGSVLECLRARGAALPEGSRAKSTRADTVGSSVQAGTTRCPGVVRGSRRVCHQGLSKFGARTAVEHLGNRLVMTQDATVLH